MIAEVRLRAALLVVMCVSAVVSAYAQQGKRTAWGDPDLQGIWPSGGLIEVPFERSVSLGTRAELTEAEYRKFAEELAAEAEVDGAESAPTSPGGGGVTPPSHWLERGETSRQTSLVVDPPNGRLPLMTDEGAKRAADWRMRTAENYPVAGPEDLTPY